MNWKTSKILLKLLISLAFWPPESAQSAVREHWIAAEKTIWNYASSKQNRIEPAAGLGVWGKQLTYRKYRYVGYTDGRYTTPLPQQEWMGILGPQLRAVVGDTLKVHFFNNTDRPLSIHPHGVFYEKRDEGADGDRDGDQVLPGQHYTYSWKVDQAAGPGPLDPSSVVWLYHSHVMAHDEMNLGLIGTLVITRKGMARSKSNLMPKDVDQEFTALFMIFDEEKGEESGLKHTINGTLFGNLDGYQTRVGSRVRWHLAALGNEVDNHTVHWHGQTVLDHGRRTDVVALMPASMVSVDMVPRSVGDWLFHCHVNDHMMAGMATRWHVRP